MQPRTQGLKRPAEERNERPLFTKGFWKKAREHAKEIPDILPRIKLDVGEAIDVQFVEDEPHLVDWEDPDEDETVTFPVIDVIVLKAASLKGTPETLNAGDRANIAVSAISMQNALGKIANDNDGLENVKARISAITYQHPKRGPQKGYRATQLRDPAEEQ